MVKRRAKVAARRRPRANGRRTSTPRRSEQVERPPIVGIGAAAGGIDAVSHLLRRLPVDTGLSFVVIQHLAPRRASQLSSVLARSTSMPVVEAKNRAQPRADHVYLIPPGVEMVLRGGRFVLSTTERGSKTPRSIDRFLCSLAREEPGRAIGVVLSGTGCDGTEGLRAIRAEGGIALVADPASARFAGMPQSAIAAGVADRVLTIDHLARELVELSLAPALRRGSGPSAPDPLAGADDRLLSAIFALVRGVSGVDFSEYKSTSFRRRLWRRMLLRRAAQLDDYLDLLRAEPEEVAALGRDILIHVTELFRDPAAFDALAGHTLPRTELKRLREEAEVTRDYLQSLLDELKARNQELNQLNSDLGNLVASIDIPIVIVSGDRRVRRFTPGARQLMNLVPSDVGRPLDDIELNVRVDSLDHHITEVLETLRVKEIEVVDRDGHWHRMQIRPYRTVDGKLDGAVISLTDIDVLKQAVGDATAARDQVSAILRTIRVPLVVLDERFVVRSANPAYYDAYGGDDAGTIGRIWFETCDGEWDTPALRAALAHALSDGGEIALEVQLDHPPGSARTIAISGSVLRWAQEAPIVLITSVDVTDRIRLVDAAEDARSGAVRASNSKDVFLATLSHELRGPLHSIALNADLLLAGAAGAPDRARAAAQAIARAAEALERIIGDLLDVSAIMAGKITLKRRPIDLESVVGAALDAVRDMATRKRLDVRLEAAAGLAPVLGDETRLQQIVGNLLGNAVKFTPPGGEVVVELEESDATARIRVTDTGKGIGPEFLPYVFDRFAQADDSNARAHGGLGLGLAIVRDLVRLHGGRVRAESEGAGKGACFTVDLPLSGSRRALGGDGDEDTDPSGQHRLAMVPETAGSERGNLDGVRVLMVDDDAGAREVLSEMLRFRGAVVFSVASAKEAMAALGEFRPDVLLCDIAMPEEDGYSLIQRIRALPADQGGLVPAVAITALATRGDRKRALAAGFQLHVAKPAPIAALCDAVRQVRVQKVRAAQADR